MCCEAALVPVTSAPAFHLVVETGGGRVGLLAMTVQALRRVAAMAIKEKRIFCCLWVEKVLIEEGVGDGDIGH